MFGKEKSRNFMPFLLLRLVIATLFLIHGIYRISAGIVDDFGAFFTGLGWDFGLQLAWLVTSLEILCGLTLLLGYFIRSTVLYLCFQTIIGLILVHRHFGWFVVGAGRNGMEYSVLLIVCLLTIYSQTFKMADS